MNILDDLLDELQSFDRNYQKHYKTLEDAARAAGEPAVELLRQFRTTDQGKSLTRLTEDVTDWQGENERRRAQLAAEISMNNRGKSGGGA